MQLQKTVENNQLQNRTDGWEKQTGLLQETWNDWPESRACRAVWPEATDGLVFDIWICIYTSCCCTESPYEWINWLTTSKASRLIGQMGDFCRGYAQAEIDMPVDHTMDDTISADVTFVIMEAEKSIHVSASTPTPTMRTSLMNYLKRWGQKQAELKVYSQELSTPVTKINWLVTVQYLLPPRLFWPCFDLVSGHGVIVWSNVYFGFALVVTCVEPQLSFLRILLSYDSRVSFSTLFHSTH